MAFTSISSLVIQVGKAIKRELFTNIKDNFDNHETRLNLVETNASKVPVFEYLILNGSSFSTATGLNYFEATTSFTITDAYVRIFEKGALAGVLQVDVKRSVTNLASGSFVTIFTTKPSVDYAVVADYGASTNAVFDPGQINISPGDYLRFDITTAPTGGVFSKFILKVYGE